ncbi:MAG: hypothetical protein ACD_39C00122G0003 [uncultured bacterium]|nr:MAG: hypothetical protein ACD_39C00122G0003 [uncultured bacterium]
MWAQKQKLKIDWSVYFWGVTRYFRLFAMIPTSTDLAFVQSRRKSE